MGVRQSKGDQSHSELYREFRSSQNTCDTVRVKEREGRRKGGGSEEEGKGKGRVHVAVLTQTVLGPKMAARSRMNTELD